jgi:aryl-alcohol dehydrogenase-like predicted oxidoreductase
MGHLLTDKTYDLIDELEVVAKNLDTTVARVALAWVAQQPRVDSTIMGARTPSQLEDNIGLTDITLSEAELDCLGELTKPEFGFPQNLEPHFPAVHHGGASVNGVYADRARIWKIL